MSSATATHSIRIIQTIAGTRVDHGGTSRSVPALCRYLANADNSVHLLTARPADPAIEVHLPPDPVESHIITESSVGGRFRVGRQFRSRLSDLLKSSDQPTVVHDHGVWLASNHAVALACRRLDVPRVISPRGMLSDWALNNGRLKKKLAWNLFQQRDLKSVTAFHVTAQMEADEVRALGYQQPIAVIPNGVDLPEQMPVRSVDDGLRRMLFLSRIHRKKGLINLVRAWKRAAPGPEWKLVIAGPDEGGHRKQIEEEAKRAGVHDQVEFPGSLDDTVKWQAYADADIFVLPSFSENFGIVVAEALAAGCPAITSTGTPWHDVVTHGVGWQTEPEVDAIAAVVSESTKMPREQLQKMGQHGATWIRDEFTWPAIARRMRAFYNWLLLGETRSDDVLE